MFEIPTILTSTEILAKANRRAQKVQVADPDFRFRMQKLNRSKVESFAGVVDSTLERYIKAFPSFNRLPPFYMALIDLLTPIDDIRRILGRLEGVRKQVGIIKIKTVRQIDRTSKPDYMEFKRKEAYGRISSMVKDLDDDLNRLAEARSKFKQLPSIPTKHPTIVVAGYPSVGKSLVVREISTADPKVAPYPFTTQELTVGYFDMHRTRYQVVDTPGLLDRPFEDRNLIEKQAILALTLLTNKCVYIVDPTGHCGFPLAPQLDLLSSVAEAIPDMEFIVAVNKSDLKVPDDVDLPSIDRAVEELGVRCLAFLKITANSRDGLEELRKTMVSVLERAEDKPWEDFQEPDTSISGKAGRSTHER
ncbi:MAG: 50S ribosome-binding GTPase [Candidatus Thermoplasmatota archaeon]|nr:50S ribosome-binding GTPase [Candidatus Thermoplasmatota archaeon]